jgi:hypothetical protein
MGFISDLFSSPKPPPPVDFGAVGQQQAATNLETARIGARLARPDVVTPYSTTTYRETAPDQYLATQTLAQPYEGLRRGEAFIQGQIQNLAAGRLGQVPTGALDVSGFQAEPTRFDYGAIGAQPTYDTSAASYELPSYAGLDAYTTDAANEFYNRAISRLNPQFDRAERRLRTQLVTSGIPEGSDAYNEEFRLFRQGKADALSDLASTSVFQGQSLQSNILGNILTGRGQQLGEIGMEYDVSQRRRQQQISEGQQQVALDREARDRQIAEAVRLRQLPLSEAAGLITGTTPFSQAAAAGPPRIAPVAGPAPVDMGALAAMGQADALARYQGQVAQQGSALGLVGTLGAGALRRKW